MFKVPEESRLKFGPLASDASYGNNGAFSIKISSRTTLWCIASCEGGWEHVSVHAKSDGKDRTPSWSEMCRIKDKFWDDEDTVIQFHPPKSEYVNDHDHTLHLWRPTSGQIILPPKDFV